MRTTSGPLRIAASLAACALFLVAPAMADGGGGGGADTVDLTGSITELLPPTDLVLDGGTLVRTSASTEWGGGLDGYGDLAVGQLVRVRGVWADGGTVLEAERVELQSGGGGDPVEMRGNLIELLPPTDLVLDGGTLVRTTADTDWQGGLDGYGDLAVGQELRVRGVWDGGGSILIADRVELEDSGGGGDDGGVSFESTAVVTGLEPPDGFALADGRGYRVDGATVYELPLTGYGDLALGQVIEVHAVRGTDGVNLAERIELESDGASGVEELEGEVAAISPSVIVLTDGRSVLHDPSTVFDGDADRWWEVMVGFRVEIQAVRNLVGDLLALSVRAEDDRPPSTAGQEFEPREALVVVTAGADPAAVAARHGAELADRLGSSAGLLRWPEEIDDQLLAVVAADPEVAAVEPNYRFRDPESVRRRYVIVDLHPSVFKLLHQPAAALVNLTGVWPAAGKGKTVAVLDTGVDPAHPFLAARLRPGGLDLVDGDDTPWEERNGLDDDGDGDVDEAAGHGTFVSSLVALVAPRATILPYRVLDDDGGGSAFNLARALAHAIGSGVDVINLSLTYHSRSTAVDLLLEEAAAAGVVVVAAAGNEGAAEVPFPASDRHAIAVTATAADGSALAPFANHSELVTLAAPGDEVYGAVDGGGFGTWSGTSMAAPLVAGAAAVLLSEDPGLDPLLVAATLAQGGAPLVGGTWSGQRLDVGRSVELIGGPHSPAPRALRGRLGIPP